MVGLRAEHEIDERGSATDFLALGLGDAAGYRDQQVAVASARPAQLQRPDPAQLRKHLLRRLLADMAGVKDDEIGVFGAVNPFKVERRQQIGHACGIVNVHLAAIGRDKDAFGHIRSLSKPL